MSKLTSGVRSLNPGEAMNNNMSWWHRGGHMGGASVWWIAGAVLMVVPISVVVWAVLRTKRDR